MGMKVSVECYAGYRGEETPRRIFFDDNGPGGRSVAVREIVDAWLAPDHRYFKVKAADESLYILRHSGDRGWEVVMMDRRPEA